MSLLKVEVLEKENEEGRREFERRDKKKTFGSEESFL